MPDSTNRKREAPISYRPPKGLREEFHARVEKSGLSTSAFITKAVFATDPPRQSRRPAKDIRAFLEPAFPPESLPTVEEAKELAPQLASLFMAGQSHGSLGIAHILTGDPHERKAIYRISQPVPDGFYTLDNTRRIRDLKDRAFAEARTQKPILQPEFFSEPAEEFVPAYR